MFIIRTAVQVWYKDCFCSGDQNVRPIEEKVCSARKKEIEGTLVMASSNYAFVSLVILNALPLAAKMTYCAFKLHSFLPTKIRFCDFYAQTFKFDTNVTHNLLLFIYMI